MKRLRKNSVKQFKYVSLLLVFGISACGEHKARPVAKNKAKEEVKAPDMALQAAVVSGNFEVVKQHIAAGTDLDEKDALSGSTPLITAITFEKNDIALALVEAGADLSIKNNEGSTALHVAAFFCRVEAVKMLLDAGAGKTVRNTFGATPREIVMGPFADMKPIYEMMQHQLGPLGLELDLTEIEKTRPVIAMMLQ